MNRYCVLCLPRSGSEMLINGIGQSYSYVQDYINLYEFFTPTNLRNEDYKINNNGKISAFPSSMPYESITDEFTKKRTELLCQGDKFQQLVMKYMIVKSKKSVSQNLLNLKKIQSHNIRLVNLKRDIFNSVLSLCVARHTDIWHKFEYQKEIYYSDGKGTWQKNIGIPKFNIPIREFESIYITYNFNNLEKENIVMELQCPTVNYNSIYTDCLDNKIPFVSPSIKKLYDEEYNNIVLNIDKLYEIKLKIDDILQKRLA